ncbi:hypothetical protein OG241_43005 [Streptomyces sp. NBC_01390]|uniref:hypothetical protein n=1 Tax=Streptomyces sp. NBC_01390 TaxID=2903850 RepID=UPI003251C604
MKGGKAWVGDQVYDHAAVKSAVVTDVRDGTYLLRPLCGGGQVWTAPSDENLTVSVARPERLE